MDIVLSGHQACLSAFSVKNQLNSFSKWGILHSEDTQWASFTGNSVSSNRDRGACQQSPCETGRHLASEHEPCSLTAGETGTPPCVGHGRPGLLVTMWIRARGSQASPSEEQ